MEKKILKIHLSHSRKAGYKSISHIDVAYWETVLTFSMDFVAKHKLWADSSWKQNFINKFFLNMCQSVKTMCKFRERMTIEA